MNVDIVIPFYNEAECGPALLQDVIDSLAGVSTISYRLVLVDDGSTDGTGAWLDGVAAEQDCVTVIHLLGNHGHQRALTAGLDQCRGGLVVMMDGDGQHPPSVMVELIRRMLVQPELLMVQALRRGCQGSGWKNASSGVFYAVTRRLMPDVPLHRGASDFRAIRREVLDMLRDYPDRHRNLRVLLASLRLPADYVEYDVQPRRGGRSGYRLRQMLALAADGWFAFSSAPLRLSLLLMLFSALIGTAYLVYVFVMFGSGRTVPGWSSIIALLSIMFTALFGVLAIMSEYVARIYEDVRGHPRYRLKPGSTPAVGRWHCPAQTDGHHGASSAHDLREGGAG